MPDRAHVGPLLILVLGCGPGVADPGGAGSGSAGSSGEASATVSAGSQGSDSDPETTTGTTTSTSTSTSTIGGSTGGGACDDGGGYRAVFIPGGLDRIRIFRRDDAANTCVWMTLAWPGGVSQYDVEVTGANEWTVEGVSRNDDASSCDGDFPGSIEDIPVPDATGEAILSGEDPSGLPCEVGVDVTLQLVPNPDPPAYVSLCAQSLDLGLCE